MLNYAHVARYALENVPPSGKCLFDALPYKGTVVTVNISSEVKTPLSPVSAEREYLPLAVALKPQFIPKKIHYSPLPLMKLRFVLAHNHNVIHVAEIVLGFQRLLDVRGGKRNVEKWEGWRWRVKWEWVSGLWGI